MSLSRAASLCVLLLACGASPAAAGEYYKAPFSTDWDATRHAIYEAENLIAFLEADPMTDDGYRAPIIARARAEIRRLQATLRPAQWRWTTPCCYSRKPIYIR